MGIKGNLTIEEVIEAGIENFSIIDVRSPSEYIQDHIPSAVNIPLLDDRERKEIGIIYKHEGPEKAKLRGVDIVSPKLPQFIRQIQQVYEKRKPVIIYCWRGGLRSEASVSFARLAGITVSKLKGGYKSYRKYVINYLEHIDKNIKFITLFGPTCSGKTELLELLRQKGLPVLNLEKYARHKGSVFGHIGEAEYPQITQKKFESELFFDIYKGKSNIYFTEGESSKIGKITVPKTIFQKIKSSIKILIDADIDFRIDFAIKSYKPELYENEILSCLENIKHYVSKDFFENLRYLLHKKNFREFTRQIMLYYYDPLYKKGLGDGFDYNITLKSLEDTVDELIKIYKSISTPVSSA